MLYMCYTYGHGKKETLCIDTYIFCVFIPLGREREGGINHHFDPILSMATIVSRKI